MANLETLRRMGMVTAMRALVGQPFRHQGATTGFDCSEAIQAAAQLACVPLAPMTRQDYCLANLNAATVLSWAHKWGRERPTGEKCRHGDLILIWLLNPGEPLHAGIFADDTDSILHARPRRGVAEDSFAKWRLRLSHVFTFHGYE